MEVSVAKTLLLSINAKHCHAAPAGRILHRICHANGFHTEYTETTINQPFFQILSNILQTNYDILIIGAYIWNIELISQLVESCKKVRPMGIIALAGPEVSYTPHEFFEKNPIDYILCGECEEILPAFLRHIENPSDFVLPPSVMPKNFTGSYSYATANFTEYNVQYYTDEEIASGRLLYFETSRGCPYQCSYCVSSIHSGVRFLAEEIAIPELLRLGSHGGVVKLLDRTFNADKQRALRIWKALVSADSPATYHFEICASLLDEESLAFLETVPMGRFQFEIGIQSANTSTLQAIHRFADVEKELAAVRRLKRTNNIHLHLDLIAGLPYEDYSSFAASFDQVYPCCHVLQLGFLKLLRGTPISLQVAEFHYDFMASPPYEILQNRFLSYEELRKLRQCEYALELFGNSGKFSHSLSVLLKHFTPFFLFSSLGAFLHDMENISQKELFYQLYLFSEKEGLATPLFVEHLKADYISANRGPLPAYFQHIPDTLLQEQLFSFYRNHKLLYACLPQLSAYSPKEIEKHTDVFTLYLKENVKSVLLFDRKYGKMVDITNHIGGNLNE